MKGALALVLASAAVALWPATALTLSMGSTRSGAARASRKVTEVVKMLEDMLSESKKEGEEERTLYAKFKCYCDSTEETSAARVKALTKEIALLEAGIEETLGSTGAASQEVAKLERDINEKVEALHQAQAMRGEETEAYHEQQGDLELSKQSMDDAIEVLSEVGADQTFSRGQDHVQYMRGFDASAVLLRVKSALLVASAAVGKEKAHKLAAFLQQSQSAAAPFTGTYSAQSGEVVGILKEMRDTFKANLEKASSAEFNAAKAFEEYIANVASAIGSMDEAKTAKESLLGANDADLARKREQLDSSKEELADTGGFLTQLQGDCATKAKQYSRRTDLRKKEDAAIAQAIAILNSDASFKTFGAVTAAPASFLQRRSVQQHHQDVAEYARRQNVIRSFMQAKVAKRSPLLLVAVSMLQAGNPFKQVVKHLDDMVLGMHAEGIADQHQLDWCDRERFESNSALGTGRGNIARLEGEIGELQFAIEDPETGIKSFLAALEAASKGVYDDKASFTADRKAANQLFQRNVADLVQAEGLLTSSIQVLQDYYKSLSFLQVDRSGVAGGADADPGYSGQSEAGANVVETLQFILVTTRTQLEEAHADELSDQHAFEDAMTELTGFDRDIAEMLGDAQRDLALSQEQVLSFLKEHKAELAAEGKLVKYLESIKDGCDFIEGNFNKRKENRQAETQNIEEVKGKIMDTPHYKQAEANAYVDSLGDCKDVCVAEEPSHDISGEAPCLACRAKVTVVGYCAGHPDTPNCP